MKAWLALQRNRARKTLAMRFVGVVVVMNPVVVVVVREGRNVRLGGMGVRDKQQA